MARYGPTFPHYRAASPGGESIDEVLANLREAAEGWLLAKQDIETNGWPKP
jgi:predicted RNase H-like HicB family nuclease